MSDESTAALIPDHVKTLADAYSRYIEVTNRAWLTATTLGLLSVILSSSEGTVQYADIDVDFRLFLWLAIAVCSAASIHYSSCQMMCYEFSKEFGQVLHDMKAATLKVTENTNLKDLSYKMVMPNYVRVFPLTLGMNRWAAKFFMAIVKPVFDVCYSVIPLITLIILSQRATRELKDAPTQSFAEASLVFAIWLIFLLAVLSLTILIWRQLMFQNILRKFSYR